MGTPLSGPSAGAPPPVVSQVSDCFFLLSFLVVIQNAHDTYTYLYRAWGRPQGLGVGVARALRTDRRRGSRDRLQGMALGRWEGVEGVLNIVRDSV